MPKTKLGHETKNYGVKKGRTASKCVLNSGIVAPEAMKFVRETFGGSVTDPEVVKDIRIIKSPFPCTVLENFVENTDFLGGLKSELESLELLEKNNDLYRFRQSGELSVSSLPHILEFKDVLQEQLRPWLENTVNITLDSTISMFCAQYRKGDTLLCHDDELEGRRIAFIFYLVPEDWASEDGGCLDLFTTGEGGNPAEVAVSLVPKYNSLVFFEVSPVSFHQVSEVLSSSKTRLSVGGWFHGTSLPRTERVVPEREPCESYQEIPEDEFYSWVNPLYLSADTQTQIQTKFEESSEISLPDFLLPDKFEQVRATLQSCKDWSLKGIPDRRRVECSDGTSTSSSSPVLSSCLQLFKSEAFFLLLSNLTGLKLHELAGSDDEDEEQDEEETLCAPRCRVSFQRWSPGNYTLVRDDDMEQDECALDLRIFFNSSGWSDVMGGQSSYIARGEDEELITVEPEDNSLSLVYRDKESLRFIKYVSQLVQQIGCFHDLSGTYYE